MTDCAHCKATRGLIAYENRDKEDTVIISYRDMGDTFRMCAWDEVPGMMGHDDYNTHIRPWQQLILTPQLEMLSKSRGLKVGYHNTAKAADCRKFHLYITFLGKDPKDKTTTFLLKTLRNQNYVKDPAEKDEHLCSTDGTSACTS